MKVQAVLVSGMLMLALSLNAGAAPGNGKGKPGGGGDDGGGGGQNCDSNALFPALVYPVASATTGGATDIVAASSDGCVEQTLETVGQFGAVRLGFDETTETGYYAWAENTPPGDPPSVIKRRSISKSSGDIIPGSVETLYESANYTSGFDLQGNWLTVVDVKSGGAEELVVVDLASCDGGLPCDIGDGIPLYSVGQDCLTSTGITGCYVLNAAGVSMGLSATQVYFALHGWDGNGARHNAIARAITTDAWQTAQVEFYLDDANYPELGFFGLDSSESLLGLNYLAGFSSGGAREDRVIIIDTSLSGTDCPCEAGLAQDFHAWSASWTVNDTIYVLGTSGKRRKMVHPIEEVDPTTGERTSLGISLTDHPAIDSSL